MIGVEIRIKGKVQGVGFRPFVWQLANRLGASGEVLNDGQGVLVRLSDRRLAEPFKSMLLEQTPPLARIDSFSETEYAWSDPPQAFTIIGSEKSQMDTQVVPDAATCPQCLAELKRPADRRYQHPFINCTHCGPRFTIIKALPYDRASTVMADFPFCPRCEAEYCDPADRRYHAQPVACPECGPRIQVTDPSGTALKGDWLALVERALKAGQIVAIKSVGGFHLACDATHDAAIAQLRARKQRQFKPFAVMVQDMDAVHALALCDPQQQSLLQSSAAPIVLLKRRENTELSSAIAPELLELGLMLPSNPIQHLIADKFKRPLVMTSANRTGLPPCLDNQQALEDLAGIADLFVLHDREIVQRCDDSLVRVDQHGSLEMLRRSRGYIPDAITLPEGFPSADSHMAYGGDLKSTFAIGKGDLVILSQYLGDLDVIETQVQYLAAMEHFQALYHFQPCHHVADLHPGYFSQQMARERSEQAANDLILVQHHHAHVAACLLEHGWKPAQGRALALALDGIGMGPDGQFWGGELLLADYRHCRQVGGIPAIVLPGGDLAAKQPWRVLLAHLTRFVPNLTKSRLSHLFGPKPYQPLIRAMERNLNCPEVRSAGRLFDAVAASLGIACDQIEYEGQAACQLEALASGCEDHLDPAQLQIQLDADNHLNLTSFWDRWLALEGTHEQKAYLFHQALALALAKMVEMAAQTHDIHTLVLTGGVFHNRLLTSLLKQALPEIIHVLEHHTVSCGDGGLALGQMAVALMRGS